MSDLERLLSEQLLFQISELEAHLYLGNIEEPRSKLVVIRGKRMEQAIRVPPISKSELSQRYGSTEIDYTTFYPRVRILLNLIGLENNDSDVLESINMVDWNDYDAIDQEETAIPVTPEIEQMVTDTTSYPTLRFHIISLLSDANRSNRQKILTELVQIRSETVFCILNYLFWIRPELSISIIRELGRQSVRLRFVLDQCLLYLNVEDKAYQLFSYAYLLQFDEILLKKSEYYISRQLDLKYYLQKSPRYRTRNKIRQLKTDSKTAANSLHYLFDFKNDAQIRYEVRIFFQYLNPNKVNKKELRSAIIDLIQFGESSQRSIFLSIGASLSCLFDTYISPNYVSELNHQFRYIRNRILSQIHIWLDNDNEEQMSSFLVNFLSTLPPVTTSDNLTKKEINDWYLDHPILKYISDQYKSVIKGPQLGDIAFHIANSNHLFLENLVLRNIKQNHLQSRSVIEQLMIYGRFSNKLKKTEELKQKQEVDLDDLDRVIINPNLLAILGKVEIFVTSDLFEQIIKKYLISTQYPISLITGFLKMVSKVDQSRLIYYFRVIEKLILQKYNHNERNPFLNEFILQVIIPWNQITGTFASEKTQTTIDTFKIIFQEKLEEFDLENSKPLAVDTIVSCYKLTDGQIPRFVEGNIQFSFTKPVWDQLARHYLALGISRPKREALAKSKLKEVPGYLTRDVLGQIALVNQTLSYCQKNGFRGPLENLIISNMYRRGWNVERGLERTLPSILGSVSPRLRSYISAYLAIEQGEISLDILEWARDIEDYLIRDRIIRELERYGTPDMWVVVANSYHPDIQERALKELKESRMSASDRSKTIVNMLGSSRSLVLETGLRWLRKYGVQQDDLISLFFVRNPKAQVTICEYLLKNHQHLNDEHQEPLYKLLVEMIWKPGTTRKLRNLVIDLATLLTNQKLIAQLQQECQLLAESSIKSRILDAISVLTKIEG